MPFSAISVLLFSTVISIIICALHASNEAEISNYEEVYRTIPVEVTVTNLMGTKSDDLEAPRWVLDVFTGENILPVLLDTYVKDLQIMSSHIAYLANEMNLETNLKGITSCFCDPLLQSENGCEIVWHDEYNETVFRGEEMLCIIPEGKSILDNGNGEVELEVLSAVSHEGSSEDFTKSKYKCTLKIVGTYIGGDGVSIYCPYIVVENIYKILGEELKLDALSATLVDNELLNEFRNLKAYWFVEASLLGQQVYWGRMGYNYYPYALVIDDYILQKTANILEDSIRFNRACTAIVFVLSAVAGFLIGFLMIRNRKREIMLMRTVGESNLGVYFGFVIEQMMCILLGIIIGGAFNLWRPVDKLLIFALIYYVGLTVALCVFLRKNLLITIKEDE